MTRSHQSGYAHCMGRLYLIATPIGNLGDITLRAVDTLRTCEILACEDTRHTRRLLSHLGISRTLISCRSGNTRQCVPRLMGFLAAGQDVAYLTDAGTPGISDPGSDLVRAARESGHEVVPLPGPSAVTTLLAASGAMSRAWFFEGFLPPKGARRVRRIEELAARSEAFLLFESPHRIGRLFDELLDVAPRYVCCLGREMTKLHEQYVVDSVAGTAERLKSGEIPARGEFAILVWPPKSG